ncbi:glycosyltransferase family 4 protein, partial [Falsiroseomonas oryzae]|uniref:glycosyltransferase family 4 protein n=1 Tax=Falsiroseomonas oryzae TaxID=2766473 RepID=UPI0022EACE8A
FCAALRATGVEARIWCLHGGMAAERREIRGVPVGFCPADAPAAPPQRRVSAALRDEVAAFAPDVALYKGLGRRLNVHVHTALAEGTRHGLIVSGGTMTDLLVPGASVVLGEHRDQLARHFGDHLGRGHAIVLPKFVDLGLAGDGQPQQADFDMVNVGSFDDPRNNQAALLPFAARRRIALIGGGAGLDAMRHAAGSLPRVTLFGELPPTELHGVLRRSRLLLHTATAEALPREVVAAMACGLPIVAFRAAITGGIPAGAGLLVSPPGLPHAVELLLADDTLRQQMGRAARRHVERNHGSAAIVAAAEQVLKVLRPE